MMNSSMTTQNKVFDGLFQVRYFKQKELFLPKFAYELLVHTLIDDMKEDQCQ